MLGKLHISPLNNHCVQHVMQLMLYFTSILSTVNYGQGQCCAVVMCGIYIEDHYALWYLSPRHIPLFDCDPAEGRLYFGSSARTVKYTAEDGWAADGLDLARVHEDMNGWDYVKAGEVAP